MPRANRYVIRKQVGGAYGVYDRRGLTSEPNTSSNLISGHGTQDEAEAAARRYAANDKRRQGPSELAKLFTTR